MLIADVGLGSVLSVLTKDSMLPTSRATHDSIVVSGFIFIIIEVIFLLMLFFG